MVFFFLLLEFLFFTTTSSGNVTCGDFIHIFDQSVGEKEKWYFNDHTFAKGDDGTWHVIGITHKEPPSPGDEHFFAHATARELLQQPWDKQAFALEYKPPETRIWAPHIIRENGIYHMFFAGGGNGDKDLMDMAHSTDLWNWTRYENNPVFLDNKNVRDPMVLKITDPSITKSSKSLFVIYYTVDNLGIDGIGPAVAYRTSEDLLNWSDRRIAFEKLADPSTGWTESPFVVHYKNHYYLFISNSGRGEQYDQDFVYKSNNPFYWDTSMKIGFLKDHASEVIHTEDDKWFVSHCGWERNGLWLAPLHWDV